MKNFKSVLTQFRIVAFLEGLSYILLVGIAVPMKYMMGITEATQHIGMAHGALFMLYVVLLYLVQDKYHWSWKQSSLAFLASLIPLGTFIAEYLWFRKVESVSA